MRIYLPLDRVIHSLDLQDIEIGVWKGDIRLINDDGTFTIRFGSEVDVTIDEAGQIAVTRIEPGDRTTRTKKRWLQWDVDGSLKFLDQKPYAPTGRKLATLPTGLGMYKE